MSERVGKGVVVGLVLAVAIYASTRAAIPDPLPGVALGWTALFHVERAGAMLGAIGVVALIAWRALSGEFMEPVAIKGKLSEEERERILERMRRELPELDRRYEKAIANLDRISRGLRPKA
jgi:hypothetical protein